MNEVREELPSPDGTKKIVIFCRNVDATTGLNTQASIIAKNAKLPSEAGNTFIIDNGDAKVRWTNDDHLLVVFSPGTRIFRNEKSVYGVSIEYKAN
jgi:hypothetical protein